MTINQPIPASWMPAAKIHRIHWHWTAGSYANAQADASGHYHFVYGPDGERYRGKSIALNTDPAKAGYAAHTLGANSGAIGLSVACMGGSGVSENPFRSGSFPMTEAQMMAMLEDTATLCMRYDVPVTPKTTLSHAEVEPNLGIKQKGKWDIARMSWKPDLVGYKACGDWMRAQVAAMIPAAPTKPDPLVKPARFIVAGVAPGKLNFRRSPGGEVIGALPEGSVVERNWTVPNVDQWTNIRTKAGFVGWVSVHYIRPQE